MRVNQDFFYYFILYFFFFFQKNAIIIECYTANCCEWECPFKPYRLSPDGSPEKNFNVETVFFISFIFNHNTKGIKKPVLIGGACKQRNQY